MSSNSGVSVPVVPPVEDDDDTVPEDAHWLEFNDPVADVQDLGTGAQLV